MLPAASIAMDAATLSPVPAPSPFAQTKFPEASNFEMNASKIPTEVKLNVPAPGSKSTDPIK